MLAIWKKHWFLITLALLISSGMTLGALGYGPALKRVTWFIHPQVSTLGVLFLMAFTLDNRKLRDALLAPAPVCIAAAINLGLAPLLGWALLETQRVPDFRLGLMIAASVPCTVAAASVLTRQARGNDAVSLLTTLGTNVLCFLITPWWLKRTVEIDVSLGKMQMSLLLATVPPILFGQLFRIATPLREFADRHKTSLSILAQVLIELMVLSAALDAGMKLRQMQTQTIDATGSPVVAIGLSDACLVWVCCLGIHVTCLTAGWGISRVMRFAEPERIAVAFAGSQKTLPIGVFITAVFSSSHPFALFPMLLYHTTQLFLDTAIATRLASRPK